MTDDDINGVAQTGVAVQLGDLASNTYFLLANLLNKTRAHIAFKCAIEQLSLP